MKGRKSLHTAFKQNKRYIIILKNKVMITIHFCDRNLFLSLTLFSV